ncbi:ParB/RepB/Spo0J family partition protein [Candidatus Parcubacteria bacterium]|nr:MAG: ParB/RepB/Spo0J family partition protein [Candidatus Parcubacteria bacterium]
MDEFVSSSAAPEEHRHDQARERKAMLKQEYIFYIETNKIKPNPEQPRQEFDQEALEGLAVSIEEHGLLQPIVVYRVEKPTEAGQDVEYYLIAGERRLRAAQMVRLPHVPAIIKEKPSQQTSLELALVENIQRTNLNPIETARAYERLVKNFGLTQRAVAEKLGKSQESVSNTLRLLTLPEQIQEAISKGEISEGHARAMLALGMAERQIKLFEEILANHLSVREAEERVRQIKAQSLRSPKSLVGLNPHFRDLIERLEEVLGTKVTLSPKGEGGKLTIDFFSTEELDGILKKFVNREDI